MAMSASDLATLLTNLVERVPGVRDAAVLSSDGQVVARSTRPGASGSGGSGSGASGSGGSGSGASGSGASGSGDLASVAGGLLSAARSASQSMPTGGVYEIIVEFEQALIVVMGIPDGSTLAVSATPPYDIGVVAYEMAILTDRTAWPRSA